MPRPSVWLGALFGLIAGTGIAAAQSPVSPVPADLPVTVVVPPPPQAVPGVEPPAEPVPVADKPPPRPADAGLGGSLRSSDEYLLWWMKSAPLPPLATRNPTGASPVLSDPNTRILIGDKADLGERSGGRFTTALPFTQDGTVGMEFGYFFLGTRTETLLAAGTNSPGGAALGRPYLDAATGRETAALIASPVFMAGEFRAASSARAQGAEANVVTDLLHGARWQIDGLVGYRFLQVYEGLSLEQHGLTFGPNSFAAPTAFGRQDQFDAHNLYHGGQIGLRGDLRKGPLFIEVTGKVAFGVNNEMVKVGGITAVMAPGQPLTTSPGGLLALPSNSGRVTQAVFAVVPEVIARVGWSMGDHSRFFVGYNFLSLSDAVRPGDQIDRTVNTSAVPYQPRFTPPARGPEQPLLALRSSDVWLQGLILGFEGRW
jgi:hypothetical protein